MEDQSLTNRQEMSAKLTFAARVMRTKPTQAESILWAALRNRKQSGLKFYRQRIIGRSIVDFYCASARLIVEIDGDIHDYQKKVDEERTLYLEERGIRVIRFKNESILNHLEQVLDEINKVVKKYVVDLTPNPPPLITGEGEG